MKYAHITDLGNFKLSDKYNDMHLLLYHWGLESEKYTKLCQNSKVYKMADNSQYELRKKIDYDDFIKWAIRVKADEVIAPDIMYDFKETKKLIEEFIPKVPKGMKILSVVCGNTLEQLAKCYDYLCNNERIDVIGMSKHGCTVGTEKNHFRARQTFLQSTWDTIKPIHLLGVNSFRDFLTDVPNKNIRSIDGKFLCKVANHNQKIDLHTKVSSARLRVLFGFFQAIIK